MHIVYKEQEPFFIGSQSRRTYEGFVEEYAKFVNAYEIKFTNYIDSMTREKI